MANPTMTMANSSTRSVCLIARLGRASVHPISRPRVSCDSRRNVWTMAKLLDEITENVAGKRNVDKLKAISRDFRSDTMTIPTDAQLLAGLRASRGDDVYGEDEDTRALEERIAKLTGKEDCLFAVSGTMTNQLAIRTHMTQPPHSVIVDHRAHVHKMEAGGIAMFSQATTHQLVPANGLHLTADDIEPNLYLGDNIHIAPTRLICLENTLSGTVIPQDEVVKIGQLAKQHDIALHLDGARIWNVAAKVIEERGMEAGSEEDRRAVLTELIEPFDTASLCLSKGIGAPIGSALVGPKKFIARARWFRKAFGGGIRQAGCISAQADYALDHHFPRLAGTHALAKRLADGLKSAGCAILAPVDTNMVFFSPETLGITLDAVQARLNALDIPIAIMRERCVVHHQIDPTAVDEFIGAMRDMAAEAKKGRQVAVNAEGEKVGEEVKMVEEATLRKQAVLGY